MLAGGEHTVDTLSSVESWAGTGARATADADSRHAAKFDRPSQCVALPSGDVLVAEAQSNCIRHISATGVVKTLIGRRGRGLKDGSCQQAQVNQPQGLFCCPDGSVLFADR